MSPKVTSALATVGQGLWSWSWSGGWRGTRSSGRTRHSGVGTLIPVVTLLAVVTAVSSAAATPRQQQQLLLSEQVSLAAYRRLLDVTGRVGLEFYECPGSTTSSSGYEPTRSCNPKPTATGSG